MGVRFKIVFLIVLLQPVILLSTMEKKTEVPGNMLRLIKLSFASPQSLPPDIAKPFNLAGNHQFTVKFGTYEFRQFRSTPDKRIIRYHQYFKGIKVYSQQLVAHFDSGFSLKKMFGSYLAGLSEKTVSLIPQIDNKKVMKIAKRTLEEDSWQFENENSELVIFFDGNRAILSYHLNFLTVGEKHGPTRPFFIIDAQAGNIIKRWEGLTTIPKQQ